MEIFIGTVTVVIGLIVASIQYDQYKINKARLEHEKLDFKFRQSSELFNRRLAVYWAVTSTISSALQNGKLE